MNAAPSDPRQYAAGQTVAYFRRFGGRSLVFIGSVTEVDLAAAELLVERRSESGFTLHERVACAAVIFAEYRLTRSHGGMLPIEVVARPGPAPAPEPPPKPDPVDVRQRLLDRLIAADERFNRQVVLALLAFLFSSLLIIGADRWAHWMYP